ncbi:YceI family protein [Cellulomonas sp. APG4]|uniref:YceI family protein n=1 Tax=Cellulomonas sp. APG4 TaxID=1538656 RepID=UPI00351BBDAE
MSAARRDRHAPDVPGPSPTLPPEHRRRWLVRTVVAVAVVLGLIAGGPWVYAQLLAPEAAAPLALQTPAPTLAREVAPSVAPADLDGAWTVQPDSEAGYRLDEVLSGQDVTVVGRTTEVAGSMTVADGSLTAAQVTVDVASIATDESARDAYFRRAMDTTANPEATFVLEQPVDVQALAATAEAVPVEAVGALTLHGVTRPVTAQLEMRRTAAGVEVAGSIPVTLTDFGLTAPDLGFVTVQPAGLVEMRLLLSR